MKNIIILILAGLIIWFGFMKKDEKPAPVVMSFEDCAKVYPVMESYPRQCKTPDGRTYAEEIAPPITYKNTSAEKIVVTNPFPGAVTGKEFKVMGKARAFYFEGSFPIDVLDSQGKILVQTYATAQGEWMVDAFVPFEANIKVPETYIGPATLVLHKDNPSGLPEHDASMSFPFTIEY